MSGLAVIQPLSTEYTPEEVLHGLDWVRWQLGGVRARCEHVHFRTAAASRAALLVSWSAFGKQDFLRVTGPHLVKAWIATSEGRSDELVETNLSLDDVLPADAAARSRHAGAVLMRGTRGARYQGTLGRFRESLASAGRSPHFLVAWAAVGHFFHLSLANVAAEHLRLEWEMGSRHLPGAREPKGLLSIAHLTSRLLHAGCFAPSLVAGAG